MSSIPSTREAIRDARLQAFSLPPERPTVATVAQQILVIEEAGIARAMAGSATSAAASAAVPQALHTLGQLAVEEVFLNSEEGDVELFACPSPVNLLFQIAAQTGCLDLLKVLIESGEELSEGTLHHAFILAARHGHHHIVNYLFAAYEISESWISYTIIEGINRKDPLSLEGLPGHLGSPPISERSFIEEPTNIADCIDDKASMAMIKHLLFLTELSAISLFEIAEHLGNKDNQEIIAFLSEVAPNRFWALDFAMTWLWGESNMNDPGTIIGLLLDHYAINDEENEQYIQNYGLSDEELIYLLATSYSHMKFGLTNLFRYCQISDEMLEDVKDSILEGQSDADSLDREELGRYFSLIRSQISREANLADSEPSEDDEVGYLSN